jgi:RNA polymerase sigma-70 factor (ECF subfamily)
MDSYFTAACFPGRWMGSTMRTASLLADEASDDLLIAQIRAGDKQSLGVLFRRYASLLLSIGRRILRNKEEADDLVQDVFLFIWRKASAFDASKGTIRSFIVHATYQKAFRRLRYLRRRHFYKSRYEDQEDDGTARIPAHFTPSYDESLEAYLGRGVLDKAMENLSKEQRDVLTLHFFGGYTFREIAVKLEQSLPKIRHYYYRGLRKLRQYILDKMRNDGQ